MARLARQAIIPGYRILGVVGEGAVLRARQLSMDRDVAIKVLSPEIAGDPEFVGRFPFDGDDGLAQDRCSK